MRLKWISFILFVSMALSGCTAPAAANGSLTATAEPVSILTSSVPTQESCGCTPKPALTLVGLVDREESWKLADLRSLGLEKISFHFPKEGSLLLDGIHLNTLLDIARPKVDAKSLTIISGDNTTVDVDLKAAQACTDCFIAVYGETSALRMVMPGFPDNTWVKAVKKLEIK
jgi:hypothetical protein